MKRLIVNADDFGMTAGVNRAIVESHREGIVTSATLMATGWAVEQAVALAGQHPGLGIGCHVVLVQGEPVLPPEKIPSLVETNAGESPKFRSGFLNLAAAATRRRLNPEEIEAEATAQFRSLQAAGIQLSHFDTHKHAHLFPEVLGPLLQAARACGIRAVRNPIEPASILSLKDFLPRPRLWNRFPAVTALRRVAAGFRRMAELHQMATTDGTVGISATGCLDEALLERMLRRLPE